MWTNAFLFLPYLAIGWRLFTSGGGERVLIAIRAFVVSVGVTVCYSVFGFLYEKSLSWLAGHWGRLQV